MANRFPIILDTDAGELKEIPSGDTLDLSNNTITGLTGVTVNGTIEASTFTSSGTNILNQVVYANIINTPNIPEDVGDLSDETNRIPVDVADLTDNSNLLEAATAFVDLSDTPDTFTGQAGKFLVVNPEETALGLSEGGGVINSAAIITALGYTPYSDANPDNFLIIEDITNTLINDSLGYTPYNGDANPSGYITGITTTDVTTALGYTPYSDSNPDGYFSEESDITDALGYTPYNGTLNPSSFINDSAGIDAALGYTPYDGDTNSLNFLASGDLTSTDITDALGYTPYDGDTNADGFISDSASIVTALGYTPYDGDTNPNSYLTGINDADVVTALGYTPYNNTNPDGFISTTTEIDTLYGYVPYDGVTNSQGFLQSESDTLDDVTSRDPSTTNSITVGGLDAGANTITTTGNINAGTASLGSITSGTTSVIDGDTAGDTLRVGGTAALTLSSASSITLQSSLVGSDAFKALGTSGTPFGTAYVTDGTIGGLRLNSDTIANTNGNITITPTTNGRVSVNAGSLGLPVKTPTTKGNLSPQSGDTVYVNDGAAQYAQVYDAGGSVWRTMTGPRFVTTLPGSGAYIGEMLVYDDGTSQSLQIWIFNDDTSANEWQIVFETP